MWTFQGLCCVCACLSGNDRKTGWLSLYYACTHVLIGQMVNLTNWTRNHSSLINLYYWGCRHLLQAVLTVFLWWAKKGARRALPLWLLALILFPILLYILHLVRKICLFLSFPLSWHLSVLQGRELLVERPEQDNTEGWSISTQHCDICSWTFCSWY